MILVPVFWEDPPPRLTHKGIRTWEDVITDLRTRPGTWARVADYQVASSASWAAGVLRNLEPDLQVTVRGRSVYARIDG